MVSKTQSANSQSVSSSSENSLTASHRSASKSSSATHSDSRTPSSSRRTWTGSKIVSPSFSSQWSGSKSAGTLSREMTSTGTDTLPLLATHTATIRLPVVPQVEVLDFAFAEVVLLILATLVVVATMVASLRMHILRVLNRRKREKLAVLREREAAEAAAAAAAKVAAQKKKTVIAATIHDTEDVEYADFQEQLLQYDDASRYLQTDAPDALPIADSMKRIHPTYGVTAEDAHQSVIRRVRSLQPRLEHLERSYQLRQELLCPKKETDLRRADGVELMYSSPQVVPVDNLAELPWLSSEDVQSIQDGELGDRAGMLMLSGRDAKRAAADRRTLNALESGVPEKSPDARSSSLGAARQSSRSLSDARLDAFSSASSFTRNRSMLSSSAMKLHDVVVSDAKSTSSGGRRGSPDTEPVLSWAAANRRSGGLFQYSQSSEQRLRNVIERCHAGPFRSAAARAQSDFVVDAQTPQTAVTIRSTDMLPDPDEFTFEGIDLYKHAFDDDL